MAKPNLGSGFIEFLFGPDRVTTSRSGVVAARIDDRLGFVDQSGIEVRVQDRLAIAQGAGEEVAPRRDDRRVAAARLQLLRTASRAQCSQNLRRDDGGDADDEGLRLEGVVATRGIDDGEMPARPGHMAMWISSPWALSA